MCIRRRDLPRTHTVPCTLLELEAKLVSFADLFQAFDVTFSRLCVTFPTDDECDGFQSAIQVLKRSGLKWSLALLLKLIFYSNTLRHNFIDLKVSWIKANILQRRHTNKVCGYRILPLACPLILKQNKSQCQPQIGVRQIQMYRTSKQS